MKRTLPVLGLVLGALFALPSQAQNYSQSFIGETRGIAALRAGPDVGYPQVAMLPARTDVRIYGCVDDWTWCDVHWRNERGWVSAGMLDTQYSGRSYSVGSSGYDIGIPIMSFLIHDYWNNHYRSRAWYREAPRWYNHRPHRNYNRPPHHTPRPPHNGQRPPHHNPRPPHHGPRPGGRNEIRRPDVQRPLLPPSDPRNNTPRNPRLDPGNINRPDVRRPDVQRPNPPQIRRPDVQRPDVRRPDTQRPNPPQNRRPDVQRAPAPANRPANPRNERIERGRERVERQQER